ncbi:NAD(P)/FAD-dependent oxidoreductase [Pseudomonas citronellolis]|uniref:NAD(P)/FAD-dependent oxidoreductase n=1 Tax=Pseudomonas citronellolis TaxID=53408 RepID=UPI0023E3FE90|nr:FAD-dependent oxidoreductase [Pseudomonas citronellolis]MDF3933585.1 FAD-dependent oxidoreductase [Pseudomonas citronellolis]
MKTDQTSYSNYWQFEAGTPPPMLAGLPAKARCLVIGAGYTGLSSALHLAARQSGVVVIDALRLGQGASGRNGGQVIPGLKLGPQELRERFGERRAAPLIRAVYGAADEVFGLIREHGIDCGARQQGWLLALHNGAALEQQRARAVERQEVGAPVQLLGAEEARRRVGSSAYLGAMLDPRGGMLQPLRYLHGLADAARRRGVSIHEEVRALSLEHAGGRWTVRTSAGEIQAEQVLIATNAYSGNLYPGLAQTHVPLWSLQAATEPLPAELLERILPGDLPVSDSYRVLRYFRRSADGRLLLGTRGAFTDRVGLSDAQRVAKEMLSIFPALAGTALSHCWSGRIAVPASRIPLLHRPQPGLTVALGYYGRGVAMATLMGRVVAELIDGLPEQESVYPVTPYRPLPGALFHRTVARVTANALRLRDVIERRMQEPTP